MNNSEHAKYAISEIIKNLRVKLDIPVFTNVIQHALLGENNYRATLKSTAL